MKQIAELNDAFRATSLGGIVLCTPAIRELPRQTFNAVCLKVISHNQFDADNDPYGEHDFGCVEVRGERYFWKIDYTNQTLDGPAEDPTDPDKSFRVMTIMHASEY